KADKQRARQRGGGVGLLGNGGDGGGGGPPLAQRRANGADGDGEAGGENRNGRDNGDIGHDLSSLLKEVGGWPGRADDSLCAAEGFSAAAEGSLGVAEGSLGVAEGSLGVAEGSGSAVAEEM